jgi:hypothetical protein
MAQLVAAVRKTLHSSNNDRPFINEKDMQTLLRELRHGADFATEKVRIAYTAEDRKAHTEWSHIAQVCSNCIGLINSALYEWELKHEDA